MKIRTDKRKRRATILLLVVSILALLFVIVTGFLSVARNGRQIVNDSRRGANVETIVEQTKKIVMSQLGEQMLGEKASDTVAGSYETIPGVRNGRFLSSILPVWSEAPISEASTESDLRVNGAQLADGADLARVVWPMLTNLSADKNATKPERYSVLDLIVAEPSTSMSDAESRKLRTADLQRFSRAPRFDADGDGIPDTFLLNAAELTELANSLAGTPVSISGTIRNDFGIGPSGAIPDRATFTRRGNGVGQTGPANYIQNLVRTAWDRYEETGRYEVAIRVVPHGGMIALDSPTVYATNGRALPPNRLFLTRTLDNLNLANIAVGTDNAMRQYVNVAPPAWAQSGAGTLQNFIFDDLANSRNLVEPLLRRRGGVLAPYPGTENPSNPGEYDGSNEAMPPVLAFLQGTLVSPPPSYPSNASYAGMPGLFLTNFNPSNLAAAQSPKSAVWQRFNLGELRQGNPAGRNERSAFITAAAPSTTDYNQLDRATLLGVSRRALVTTTSNSDEIARKLDPATPTAQRRPNAAPPRPDPSKAGNAPLQATIVSAAEYAANAIAADLKMPAGTLKFYLGDIFTKYSAKTVNGREVFPFMDYGQLTTNTANGNYVYVPGIWDVSSNVYVKVGDAVVEELASRFYDMLGGHSDREGSTNDAWDDALETPRSTAPTNGPKDAISRRQQAISLAVNTLAFAAPRSIGPNRSAVTGAGRALPAVAFGGPAYIDAVTYTDWKTPIPAGALPSYTEYVGYAPQFVFSEAVAVGVRAAGSNEQKSAILVELYNPNDPLERLNGNGDLHGINLADFAISTNGFNPNTDPAHTGNEWTPLDPGSNDADGMQLDPVRGRTFRTVLLRNAAANATTSGIPDIDNVADVTPASPRGAAFNLNLQSIVSSSSSDRVGMATEYDSSKNSARVLPLSNEQFYQLDLWRKGVRFYSLNNAAGGAPSGTRTMDSSIVWYHVDRILVRKPETPPPPQVGDEGFSWWTSTARDMVPSRNLGWSATWPEQVGYRRYARWRCVSERITSGGNTFDREDGISTVTALLASGASSPMSSPKWVGRDGTAQDPDAPGAIPWAPEVPLVTMNAGGRSAQTPGGGQLLKDQLTDLPLFDDRNDLRPRSFPTAGFMLFLPRFAHVRHVDYAKAYAVPPSMVLAQQREMRIPVSMTLAQQWRNHYGVDAIAKEGSAATGSNERVYPADFGHMPLFDNTQRLPSEMATPGVKRYLDEVGKVPWGQLVFDYFTTVNPDKVDPYRVPGRIDVNAAPWMVLAQLPIIGPRFNVNRLPAGPAEAGNSNMPLRGYVQTATTVQWAPPAAAGDPSATFWRADVGGLAGVGWDPAAGAGTGAATAPRSFALDPYLSAGMPANFRLFQGKRMGGGLLGDEPDSTANQVSGRYRLGPWLAQAAQAYRDGIQIVKADANQDEWKRYADAQLRNGRSYASAGELSGAEFINGGTASLSPQYRAEFEPKPDGTFDSNRKLYGEVRGQAPGRRAGYTTAGSDPEALQPKQFGFLSIGELLNVKGFDATTPQALPLASVLPSGVPQTAGTSLYKGDFLKAVSIVALMDTNYITTRSNTFTVYMSIMDRENPERSVRTQTTIDRTNVLMQQGQTGSKTVLPEVIADTKIGYFNTRYDQ